MRKSFFVEGLKRRRDGAGSNRDMLCMLAMSVSWFAAGSMDGEKVKLLVNWSLMNISTRLFSLWKIKD